MKLDLNAPTNKVKFNAIDQDIYRILLKVLLYIF